MRKILFSTFTLLFVSLFVSFSVRAAVCGEAVPQDEGSLRTYIEDCEQKIASSRGTQATLSSAINQLNSQISLTQAKINSSQLELDKLEQEISDLSGKITTIDLSLDDLTALFVSRVRSSYIYRDHPSVTLVSQATGIGDLVRNAKYLLQIRDRDREILLSLEKSRLDFDYQKKQKELKLAEIESIKKRLDSERAVLAGQKSAKDRLLAETKNDEKKYQSLLSQANAQMAAFRRFVSGQGGSSLLSDQTICNDWGCYYNQRDSQWGSQTIGSSSETMNEVGCLVTSMAMIATHYGKSVRPGDIAASSSPFFSNTAYMNQGTWSAAGLTATRTRIGSSVSAIDSELDAGRPVVVGIYGGPDHFVVVKGKEGGDYIMHDPFVEGGHDLKFTSKYPLSAISAVDRVIIN